MTKREYEDGKINLAGERSFANVPFKDERIVSKDGDKAAYLRHIIRKYGPQTKRELTEAWAYHRRVFDDEQINKEHKATIRWVNRRVERGELKSVGLSGDEHGSKLYGFVRLEDDDG